MTHIGKTLNSSWFSGDFGRIISNTFQITESDLEKITSLKYFKSTSSYYSELVKWRLKDNPQIKDYEELSRLFAVAQFLSMVGSPTEELIKKHDLKEYHIDLLHRLYLEYDDSEECIMMAYKRPFGNSSVLYDIREAIGTHNEDFNDDLYNNEDFSEEEKVLLEFNNFLIDYYKGGFELNWRNFVYCDMFQSKNWEKSRVNWEDLGINQNLRVHYLQYWTVDPADIRNKKIETLLM